MMHRHAWMDGAARSRQEDKGLGYSYARSAQSKRTTAAGTFAFDFETCMHRPGPGTAASAWLADVHG